VLIYKRLGDTKVKLWNNELERIFKFSMPDSAYLEYNFSSNNILTGNNGTSNSSYGIYLFNSSYKSS
jgi:hypothetical protein